MNNPLKEFRPESLCLLKETQEDYWRYARKGPHDFSVYTEKSSIYETPTKERFKESSDVLVRWTDGLLYLATIIQVEDEYSRCAVKFEDGSQFWALYKDIYKGPSPENEFACTVCDSNFSQPPDEIVICDKCSVGYHQMCHIPKIATSDLNPELPWSCRKCVFAAAAKKGGASKKGSNAQLMHLMKEVLPYNLESLTWDSSHRSNLQQTYCYCGGPGEWYSKMLQCLRCKQWFHEACVQCLEDPLLYGDRFYIFVCTVCNKGPEFLKRLPLRWPDIAHLVLFNLTVMHGKKFFEFDTTIMTFIKENWSQFQIKGEVITRMPDVVKKKKLLEHLQNSKSRFTSGKEMKRKTAVWGLKNRVPPPTPAVSLPKSGVINNAVLDSFHSAARKMKPVNRIPVPVKRLRKSSIQDSDAISSEPSPKVAPKPAQPPSPPTAQPTVEEEPKVSTPSPKKKKERRKLPYRLAKSQKQQNGIIYKKVVLPRRPSSLVDLPDSDDTSSRDTLNSIIPHPNNFEGLNNPFTFCIASNDESTNNSRSSSRSSSSNSSTTEFTRTRSRKQKHPKQSILYCSSTSSNSSIADSTTSSNSSRKQKITQQYIQQFNKTSSRNGSAMESRRSRKQKTQQSIEYWSSTSSNSSKADSTTSSSYAPRPKITLPFNGIASNSSKADSITPTYAASKQKISLPSNSTSTNFLIDDSTTSSNSTSKQKTQQLSNSNSSEKSSSPVKPNFRLRLRSSRKSLTDKPSNSVLDQLLNSPQTDCLEAKGKPVPLLSSDVSEDRINSGEKFTVLAKRTTVDGKVQYLIEWENDPVGSPRQLRSLD